ncbi:Uncharacterised protein [Mycobacteroides abscessus subsp. abscessus]|nr:Uncharacterised protein [Mycobacteroides abscessus subsp. abscessus]
MNPAHGVGGFNGAVTLVFLDVEQQAVFRGSLYHPFEGDVGESVVIGIVTADIGVDAREPRLIDQSLIAQEFDEVFPIGSASLVDGHCVPPGQCVGNTWGIRPLHAPLEDARSADCVPQAQVGNRDGELTVLAAGHRA